MKKQKPLKTFAFRFDERQMKRAQELGIDLGDLFRLALARKLLKADNRCPVCGEDGCRGSKDYSSGKI